MQNQRTKVRQTYQYESAVNKEDIYGLTLPAKDWYQFLVDITFTKEGVLDF